MVAVMDGTTMSSFHPTKTGLINLYEVVDAAGNALWGGDSGYEAIKQFRNSPVNCRLLVSGWDSDAEDARLVGQPIDITSAVVSAIAFSRE
jgi:hypothetical protein